MALILCPECQGKVSTESVICVHCGFPIAKVELPSDNSASPPTNIKSDLTTTSSEQKITESEFEPKADSPSITQSNNEDLWASGSVLKNSHFKFWIIGIFIVIFLISIVRGSDTNSDKIDWAASWQTSFNMKIAQALNKADVYGCGLFEYKKNTRNSNKYLVRCSNDGTTWKYLVVDIRRMTANKADV
jgi:hypothetical protein